MDRVILQTRLVEFGVMILNVVSKVDKGPGGNVLAKQLAKSGTSPSLNYAESQNAESTRDFVHKLRIALKELRETAICLKIIEQAELCDQPKLLSKLRCECNELVAIFVSSINTASKNSKE
jgi:four helix bundle protein